MSLTDQRILKGRRSAACCALEESYLYVQESIHGGKCAHAHLRKARMLQNIADRLCDVNTSTETGGCLTDAQGEALLDKLACYCKYGGCRHDTVPDCTITPDYIVDGAGSYADLPVSPAIGFTYYILSGTNAGEIAEFLAPDPDFNNDFNNDFLI